MVEQHGKTLVPQIRFAGFTDPWEQRKLGELTEIKDSARIPNRLWREAGVPYIRASDISQENLRGALFIDEEDYAAYKAATGAPEKGDVLFNGGGEIGKAIINGNSSPIYVQGGAVLYARIAHSSLLDARYLVAAFVTQNVVNAIGVLSAGGTMKHFTLQPAKNLPIEVPNIAEQRRIGAFFDRLDSLITLHQRKYDKLCVLKKSMLDKMFPKGGSLYPEIRFAGFTDPWEQRKLGEFGSVAMCKRIYKEQTSEQGDVPFFKIGTFGANPDAFISNELFEDFKRIYPYPTPGTLLISAAGSIGRVVEYQGEKAYFQDSNIVWLEHDHRLNDAFLKPLYSRIEWGLEGSTIKRLYNKDLLSAEVTVPGSREQKEIGQFFAKLDTLITLHQRKLELLRNIKKSMLDKMFV